MKVSHFLFCMIVIGGFIGCTTIHSQKADWKTLEKVFVEAPDSIQTSVYWYWISDNLSKEGVVKDLHAMKEVGINRAFIGNIGLNDLPDGSYGSVKIFTDEWWDILHTALKTATELGIDIGIFNSPGWSQSGGPWVKPDQAMRYLAAADTLIKGPLKFMGKLPIPAGDFQRLKTLAFRVPKEYGKSLADLHPKIGADFGGQSLENLVDKDRQTEVALPSGTKSAITASVDSAFIARSLTIHPARRNMGFDVTLEAMRNGAFEPIKSFRLDRTNNALNVGFEPYAPVVVSFDAIESNAFRFVFDKITGNAGIAEIELTSTPRVERFKEKSLVRMHPTPLPYWHDYQWERQPEPDDEQFILMPSDVKDITSQVSATGELTWDVPEGNWTILQTGMLPTGVTNAPASPEGTGLEVDKMNHEHVLRHFDAFLGEILHRIPEEDRKTFKVAVQDSYETGGQNWTDGFEDKFKQAFGYDPTPYIPVFYGHVVGSQDQSDRFLWDVRRFVADKVAYEYVGGLRDVSHKHGLTIWLENYGHWGFPGEFLQYGGQSDEVAGEFWSEGELGDIENRAASSAAHIYGKNKVSAESFTAAGNTFGRYPALFKQRGDRFFAEGINNTLLHVYIHQPYENKRPGVNAWFGNEFNRFNTWYNDMDLFVDYLKRCNFLLQQGRYVADVAYFIGEDAPKMTGVQDPALPKGYSFDYMNAEVILNRISMKNGRFTLPDGLSYRILVLPKLETIRPELLRKIEQLVARGGIVLGPRPQRSPSLADYGEADKEVQMLADKLWGNLDGNQEKEHVYGKGLVLQGLTLEEALERAGVLPDIQLEDSDPVAFIHRTLPEGDIYFVSNQSDGKIQIDPTFRITGKQPELWNAVHGKLRDLPEFDDTGSGTTVPLELDGYESAFIVFRKTADEKPSDAGENFPAPENVIPLQGDWLVDFIRPDSSKFTLQMDTLTDWSLVADTAVAHFSGTAWYRKEVQSINLPGGAHMSINLGSVVAVAKVRVNGQDVGGVWTPPYRLDITSAWKKGDNTIEIKVVNTWANRLIGDQKLPAEERGTWTLVNPYKADSPLHPSGLTGPVRLEIFN
ncbi:glycosyl hydrolase [Parapedobacter indicus]|uniref:Alpha-L-rhamnosidase n=1 Tax=Parapedobacter indicus TaxID=1477437 RepID=A0A1I3FDL1_9SPHI|nr:glycosyl hydrolase [Parapedobacter indicus]PPL03671.1 alpha-L-rhamnosidase-like protein [Parapedobacter indicus]SFI09289.1 alpha-L-rhamnosidase [Parapedobacter indicus]